MAFIQYLCNAGASKSDNYEALVDCLGWSAPNFMASSAEVMERLKTPLIYRNSLLICSIFTLTQRRSIQVP
ncbi:hypothetical protein [Allocoleopsis franciscana]|uniref:Uncharacterized protein n=1 Tax=Allocoleopsis franciscana PCC 7113 TaxID=1173027 RepID=K9WPK7_9CYAN|nr:hypothetical protein [Allocoleopsis franciscana]AFZ21482.1 hypothetical protein Mic7113_5869 [Allocoleopsis franciscana PCC 7113]